MAVLTHLIAPRESSPRYGLDHEFSLDSDEFCSSIVGATGVPYLQGNRLEIFNNGDEFYPVMLDAINAAKHSITIEAYIYWAGEIGQQFGQAFAKKSREGVKVKLLLDAIGAASIGEDILRTLQNGGCQIAWFNPIRWYSLGRFNNRTHRKSLIIDGCIAFTGGAGIADHWRGHAQNPEHWRDIQIKLEGPAVLPLQTGFAQNWLETTGELVSGFEFYPPPQQVGSVALQTILSSPQTGASSVRIMYYFAIVCSRRMIYIANPYFVPDQAGIDTLLEAKKRGVDVKIMVSGIHNDNRMVRHNSRRLYAQLLAGGVEVYEYNRTMLHHKIMVVDGMWATVGTTNFDNRSFAHNEENNVCFFDPPSVTKLRTSFENDLQHCERVTLDRWRRRGVWNKAQELLASLLQEQM
ncbi:MAG TPA: phospholipase D-like domain-containing protein [Bryobacteraceae bacterium]|nr:phospholipase D-like domain-containing protein [Bryobacteraceae bacterium]